MGMASDCTQQRLPRALLDRLDRVLPVASKKNPLVSSRRDLIIVLIEHELSRLEHDAGVQS
jgi:hypothetical protein